MDVNQLVQRQLCLSAERLEYCWGDIAPAEAQERPHSLTPVVWHVGHLAYHEGVFAAKAGHVSPVPASYESMVKMGTSGDGSLPMLDAVVDYFRQVQDLLLAVAAGDLAESGPSGGQAPSLADQLLVLHWHRGYHQGKLMTLRGLLGKPILI